MNNRTKSVLLWILSFILMAGFAIYQRMTGPTYPVRGDIEINNAEIDYRLPRSHDSGKDALVKLDVSDKSVKGFFHYRRFKSHDEWTRVEMVREGENLHAFIPEQPPAGKVMYKIELVKDVQSHFLTDEAVIIRFKGSVPAYILIPHIIFMFLAMVFSIRTGFEALSKGRATYKYTIITTVLLFAGGLVLGPIVQKYAFDAYWTGWPFGHDLTDNKTIFSFIFWVIALLVLRKNPDNKLWPILAAVVLIAIYLIPHSVLGSEIDYTAIESANP